MRRWGELLADWLLVLGAAGLFISLFLTWSRAPRALPGVARDPTAWQVYSIVDVVLALLSVALIVVALVGRRRTRIGALMAAAIALAFAVHAHGTPPTNGAVAHERASAGVGDTVAIVSLSAAIAGLGLSSVTGGR